MWQMWNVYIFEMKLDLQFPRSIWTEFGVYFWIEKRIIIASLLSLIQHTEKQCLLLAVNIIKIQTNIL